MTNSHLLGGITFGSFALFALLTWWVSCTHPTVTKDPQAQRTTRFTALFLLLLGAGLGYFAFVTDYRMRVTTLQEVMVEGNVASSQIASTSARVVTFTVEHPGVAHELFISPTSELLDPPKEEVRIAFSLSGPDHAAVQPERTETFGVRAGSENERPNWNGKTFRFTPISAGAHSVRIKAITPGIPRIQVRIVDPSKRNGERMSGY